MFTEYILLSIFLFFLGVIFGKFFKGLNPFLMAIGLLLSLSTLIFLTEEKNALYNIVFGIGFLSNYKKPRNIFEGIFSEFRMNMLLAKEKRAREKERQRYEQAEFEQRQRREKEQSSRPREREDSQRRQQEQEARRRAENQARREREAREEAERIARELKEKLERQRNNTAMPRTFEEACEILETPPGSSLNVFKQAYRNLIQQYHEDKCNHLGKRLRDQAKIETQRINKAWDIIKNKFGVK